MSGGARGTILHGLAGAVAIGPALHGVAGAELMVRKFSRICVVASLPWGAGHGVHTSRVSIS